MIYHYASWIYQLYKSLSNREQLRIVFGYFITSAVMHLLISFSIFPSLEFGFMGLSRWFRGLSLVVVFFGLCIYISFAKCTSHGIYFNLYGIFFRFRALQSATIDLRVADRLEVLERVLIQIRHNLGSLFKNDERSVLICWTPIA